MNNPRSGIWQLLPTILVAALAAFVTSYFTNRLINAQPEADSAVLLWLVVCGILAAIVAAFTVGQRQVAALWRRAAAREQRAQERRLASWRQLAEKVHTTLMDLADQYEDTPEDRLRIRIVYHKDTFAALIAALEAVPVHELGSADAAVALCGLKRNLRDAHYLVDLYASPTLPGNIHTACLRAHRSAAVQGVCGNPLHELQAVHAVLKSRNKLRPLKVSIEASDQSECMERIG